MKIKFGVIGLNHGHVYWMIKGLLGTGKMECVGYFAEEPELQTEMKRAFPLIPRVTTMEELLGNSEVRLICTAARNDLRAQIAIRAMKAGKDVFVDKPGATLLSDLVEIEKVQRETGKSWFVWFCERLPDPSSDKALELIRKGTIGQVVNFIGLGPHKINRSQRPKWFFEPQQYGGLINDLAIHSTEMFCQIVGESDIVLQSSHLGNFRNRDLKDFYDFGDLYLKSSSGITAYIRTDWLTPETMPSFGDSRQIIIGTEGMIELRKTVDLGVDNTRFTGHQLILATHQEAPHRFSFDKKSEKIFEEIVSDVLLGKNQSIPHQTSFLATRLALQAQAQAEKLSSLTAAAS
jgi:predicted dehydrogenase